MKRVTKLVTAALLCALTILPGGTSATAHMRTMADTFRATLRTQAAAHHIDLGEVLRTKTTVSIMRADGKISERQVTLNQAITALFGSIPSLSQAAGQSPAGLPELSAGDVAHLWACALCKEQPDLGYTVTKSALVPSTPAVEPLGIPIIAFEAGGPLYHIHGTWPTGLHLAGFYLLGSNVDTDASGPYIPDPTFLLPVPSCAANPADGSSVCKPWKGIGAISDKSMDFLGHVAILVSMKPVCFLGYCVGAGLLDGDGVEIFDNYPLLGQVNVVFPDVP